MSVVLVIWMFGNELPDLRLAVVSRALYKTGVFAQHIIHINGIIAERERIQEAAPAMSGRNIQLGTSRTDR